MSICGVLISLFIISLYLGFFIILYHSLFYYSLKFKDIYSNGYRNKEDLEFIRNHSFGEVIIHKLGKEKDLFFLVLKKLV